MALDAVGDGFRGLPFRRFSEALDIFAHSMEISAVGPVLIQATNNL